MSFGKSKAERFPSYTNAMAPLGVLKKGKIGNNASQSSSLCSSLLAVRNSHNPMKELANTKGHSGNDQFKKYCSTDDKKKPVPRLVVKSSPRTRIGKKISGKKRSSIIPLIRKAIENSMEVKKLITPDDSCQLELPSSHTIPATNLTLSEVYATPLTSPLESEDEQGLDENAVENVSKHLLDEITCPVMEYKIPDSSILQDGSNSTSPETATTPGRKPRLLRRNTGKVYESLRNSTPTVISSNNSLRFTTLRRQTQRGITTEANPEIISTRRSSMEWIPAPEYFSDSFHQQPILGLEENNHFEFPLPATVWSSNDSFAQQHFQFVRGEDFNGGFLLDANSYTEIPADGAQVTMEYHNDLQPHSPSWSSNHLRGTNLLDRTFYEITPSGYSTLRSSQGNTSLPDNHQQRAPERKSYEGNSVQRKRLSCYQWILRNIFRSNRHPRRENGEEDLGLTPFLNAENFQIDYERGQRPSIPGQIDKSQWIIDRFIAFQILSATWRRDLRRNWRQMSREGRKAVSTARVYLWPATVNCVRDSQVWMPMMEFAALQIFYLMHR